MEETKTQVKQKLLGAILTPQEVIAALIKSKQGGKAKWWQNFEFEIVDGLAKLKCLFCGTFFSPENPSQRAGTHFNDTFTTCIVSDPACKKRKDSGGASTSAEVMPSTSASGSNQAKITSFIAPISARRQCMEHLKMFFYTNPVGL
jgi:hypothetical protein